jgi:hypothetical protein
VKKGRPRIKDKDTEKFSGGYSDDNAPPKSPKITKNSSKRSSKLSSKISSNSLASMDTDQTLSRSNSMSQFNGIHSSNSGSSTMPMHMSMVNSNSLSMNSAVPQAFIGIDGMVHNTSDHIFKGGYMGAGGINNEVSNFGQGYNYNYGAATGASQLSNAARSNLNIMNFNDPTQVSGGLRYQGSILPPNLLQSAMPLGTYSNQGVSLLGIHSTYPVGSLAVGVPQVVTGNSKDRSMEREQLSHGGDIYSINDNYLSSGNSRDEMVPRVPEDAFSSASTGNNMGNVSTFLCTFF